RAAEVLEGHGDRFRAVGLAARARGDDLLALARRLRAPRIALVDEEAAGRLHPHLRRGDPELRTGEEGVLSLVREPGADTILQAIGGAAGLSASLLAARLGKRLALANKESMVVAGPLLTATAK